MRAVLAANVSRQQIVDALAVSEKRMGDPQADATRGAGDDGDACSDGPHSYSRPT